MYIVLSYSACVLIVMFVPSNVNVSVAEILWKFSVWWCFVFVNSTAWSELRHVRFIGIVQSIQLSVLFVFHVVSIKLSVSIVNMYQSLLVSLFFRHFIY